MLDEEPVGDNEELEEDAEDGCLHIEDEGRSDPVVEGPEHYIDTIVMYCGLVVFLMEDGSTVPADVDWFTSKGAHKATCIECKEKWS